ncbi:MAG TPA: hypothetical protein VF342_05350 [Alphaproteobacteria bacterium]
MRALKALVAVMTVLLVIGFGIVIWGIARQINRATETPPETTAPAPSGPAVSEQRVPWDRLMLNQPPGTRIAGVSGAGGLIVVHLYTGEPGRDERLVVIDPDGGTMLGTVSVTGGP